MRPPKRVLVVAANGSARGQHRLRLRVWGYAPVSCVSAAACVEELCGNRYDSVLCDGVTSRLVRQLAKAAPRTAFVLVATSGVDLARLRLAVHNVASGQTHGVVDGFPDGGANLREMVRRATAGKRGPKSSPATSTEAHTKNDSFGASVAPRFSPDQGHGAHLGECAA